LSHVHSVCLHAAPYASRAKHGAACRQGSAPALLHACRHAACHEVAAASLDRAAIARRAMYALTPPTLCLCEATSHASPACRARPVRRLCVTGSSFCVMNVYVCVYGFVCVALRQSSRDGVDHLDAGSRVTRAPGVCCSAVQCPMPVDSCTSYSCNCCRVVLCRKERDLQGRVVYTAKRAWRLCPLKF
jgi:hypothetical protein